MSSAWFPSNMMLRIEVHQTRESCFSQSEGPLGAVLKFPNWWSPAVMFVLLQISPIYSYDHGAQLEWPFCSWSQSRQGPSASVAQFGQEASSRKSPGCFKLPPLCIMEATCFCEPSMKQFFSSELFSRCVAWRKPVSELYRQFFRSQGLVFALICIISC